MKILQWSMTIPKSKQDDFAKWFNEESKDAFDSFGAKKHELHKVEDEQVVGRQTIEKNSFIERIYFDNDYDFANFFRRVKSNPITRQVSRMYEDEFGAQDIKLRVLVNP